MLKNLRKHHNSPRNLAKQRIRNEYDPKKFIDPKGSKNNFPRL